MTPDRTDLNFILFRPVSNFDPSDFSKVTSK